MADLTKQDKKDIKDIVSGTLEDSFPRLFEKALTPLASAIQKDFESIHKRFDKIDKRFDFLEERLGKVENDTTYLRQWTGILNQQIDDIKEALKKVVYRDELEALEKRVERLERVVEKSGIEK